MEDEDELMFLFITITLVQMSAYLLSKLCQDGNRRWWMLPDKRERSYLGVYTTLFLKYKHTNHEEFFKMTRLTVKQFEDLLTLTSPDLQKNSNREFLDPEFRLAFTVW